VSGISCYGDYQRAEILSCVSTVFLLIPMYYFIQVSRHFPSIDANHTCHHKSLSYTISASHKDR
jgi:hypothetical protein